jgi:glycosyltransferase involved in cell wall biosynthesis
MTGMRVWLVNHWEDLPTDDNARKYRTGMLADGLRRRGHRVTWWSATRNQRRGILRARSDSVVEVDDGYCIRLLHVPLTYRRNVSARRLAYEEAFAWKFSRAAALAPAPDVVVASMPWPTLAKAAVLSARRRKTRGVVDIRDMWPDSFSLAVSTVKRVLGAPISGRLRANVRTAVGFADGIVGINPGFLDWGLGYADRARRVTDNVFPIGYDDTDVPSAKEQQAARDFWEEHGLSLPSGSPLAVFWGRMSYSVDMGAVIEGARACQERGISMRFVLCGEGDELQRFRSQAASLENCVFPGHVGRAELVVLGQHAAMGLLPIRRQFDYQASLSNKMFEYLAAGLPVISHLNGVAGDLIKTHDLGAVYGDAEEFVNIVTQYALNREQRERAAKNSRRVFEEQFRAQTIYEAYAMHLENMVEQGDLRVAGGRSDRLEINRPRSPIVQSQTCPTNSPD